MDKDLMLNQVIQEKNESKVYWFNKDLDSESRVELLGDDIFKGKYEKDIIGFKLEDTLIERLKKVSKNNDILLYTIFIAALNIQLYKYTGKENSIVGMPDYAITKENEIAERNKVLPLVSNLNKSQLVKELIVNIRNEIMEVYKHKFYAIDKVLKRREIGKEVMEITNISLALNTLHAKEDINYIYDNKYNQICIKINNEDETLSFEIAYNANMFNEKFIKCFGNRYVHILAEMMNNFGSTISELSLLTIEDQEKVSMLSQPNEMAYAKDKTIQEVFEEQVKKVPNQYAVVYKESVYTYEELNRRANILASTLRKKGVTSETIVAIMLERTCEAIVGILGILKAGGAYLPIDTKYPSERVNYMLNDSKAKYILTRKALYEGLQLESEIIDIEAIDFEIDEPTVQNEANSQSLAYIIYTSGSTGKPKGVQVEHKNVINLCNWFGQTYNLAKYKNVLQNTSISFDVSVEEIFGALLNGGTLYLTSEKEVLNKQHFREYIRKHNINVVQLVPTTLQEYLVGEPKLESIKVLLCGGEALPQSTKDIVLDLGYELYNCYGPTETTVDAITTKCQKGTVVIGKPIANTIAYILNKDHQLQAVNLPGELYITGEGLTRGYLNRSELTNERFIENPFLPNTKIYKTGDLVRWLDDGTIEFLGRVDQQVKIKGYRIELGEIENALVSYTLVKEAVVIVREKQQDKVICAYITTTDTINDSELKVYLSKLLPHYMVPAYIMEIDRIPLTTNGKIERKKLPEPNFEELIYAQYEAPKTQKQKILVKAYEEVLNLNQVGINDNFFDLGGDSIKAIRITSKLANEGYTLEVQDLFELGTIKEISNKLIKNKNEINQEMVTGEVILSPIQRLFFEKKIRHQHHWNQSTMLYRKAGFDEYILQKVFTAIINHHDVLRSVFIQESDLTKQVIKSNEGKLYDLVVEDYKGISEQVILEEKIKESCANIQASINLQEGPLVKLGLFKTSQGDHLLIAIHHLVIDGISWRIIAEDFNTAYEQCIRNQDIQLAKKTNSFKDWTEYLTKVTASQQVQKQIDYWKQIEAIKIKDLPVDRKCCEDEVNMGNCKQVAFKLTTQETQNLLYHTNRAYNTEINDILLTALSIALSKWTKQKQIKINMEGHGREQIGESIDISRTVGWFTTHYPVVVDIDLDKTMGTLIKEVKENLRKIENKGIGYGLLKYMDLNSGNWESKEPQISFNYLGEFDEVMQTGEFEFSSIESGPNISEFAQPLNQLDINGQIINKQLEFTLTYNCKQYEESTMNNLVTSYKESLLKIVDWCKGRTKTENTPSDYSGASLGFNEIDTLKAIYEDQYKLEIQDIYELSPMQEGMLFHALLDTESTAYFEQASFVAKGSVDIDKLKKSFQMLIQKYDILRSVIAYKGLEKPKQVVLKERQADIYYEDISNMPYEEQLKHIQTYEKQERMKGFDLEKDCLMRLSIFRLGQDVVSITWSSHHILLDGWSSSIVLQDFFELYKQGENFSKPVQFSEYIKWLAQQNQNEADMYWQKYLEGYTTEAKIPFCHENDIANGYIQGEQEFDIGKEVTEKLQKFSQDTQVTLNVIMQTIWGLLLQKYNNCEDVVFGSVVSGRNAQIEGIDQMVGLFINTIPVRVKLDSKKEIKELLKQAQKQLLESNQYAFYPLAEIQKQSAVKGNLFYSKIAFQNFDIEGMDYSTLTEKCGFTIEGLKGYEETNYDLNIKFIPDRSLKMRFSYNQNVYDELQIKKIYKHFENLLKQLMNEDRIRIDQLDVITEEETKTILEQFNTATDRYSEECVIQTIFEQQANKCGNKIAAIYKQDKLTYKMLNEKANQVAHYLKQQGIQTNECVGLMLKPSVELLVGMLGIIKAGAAYMPINLNYPKERIAHMLKDAGSRFVLTEKELVANIDFDGKVLDIRDEVFERMEITNPAVTKSADDIAYVIYTSGTTGTSKGVQIREKSVINYYSAMTNRIGITEKDKTLLLSSYAFDLGYTAIFTALMNGIAIELLSEEDFRNPEEILKAIAKEVTYIKITPSMLNMLLGDKNLEEVLSKSSLRTIILGGESIRLKDVALFKEKDRNHQIRFLNHYGPTECTIGCLTTWIDEEKINLGKNIVGKPLENLSAYIMNEQKQLVPTGIIGELYIGGAGLAKGYLNCLEFTKQKFIENPYRLGETIYRTGDLARWTEQGEIEFLGRADDQVKIRGFRVEIGEIESRLLSYAKVKEVIVVLKQDALCAYIVADETLDMNEVRKYIKQFLPEYMVPTYYIQIAKMPLTSNGKVDKKKLREPQESDLIVGEYEAPQTLTEEKLVKIWREILAVEKIGINDDFFDLGGHSLKLTILKGKIYEEFNVNIELRELFSNATIRQLAQAIDTFSKETYEAIQPCQVQTAYLASVAQKRMYLVQQLEDSTVYNMPLLFEVVNTVESETIEKIFNELISRHEALRTTFYSDNNEVYQKIEPAFKLKIATTKVPQLDKAHFYEEHVKVFKLDKLPLFHVELIETKQNKYLFIDMHHIISDGVSLRILIKEFLKLYNGMSLETLNIQYKDYTQWQNSEKQQNIMKQAESYWINKFKENVPALNLPYDNERGILQSYEGDKVDFKVDHEIVRQLNILAGKTQTTMHMLLLAAYYILLSKYSRQDDIVVGIPVVGRNHADLQSMIGVFINMLPIRMQLDANDSYKTFLMNLKGQLLEAYEYQNYQLEELIDKINLNRDLSRNPLFDVMFDLKHTEYKNDELYGNIFVKQESIDEKKSKYDLTLNVIQHNDELVCSMEYCSRLFNRETIKQYAASYQEILRLIVSQSDIKVKDLEPITKDEMNVLLNVYNQTQMIYPKSLTIAELFEQQVVRTPDAIAVTFENQSLSYKQLNSLANKVANILHQKRVQKDQIIGLMMERSIEMIVGILAILKAGGAYLPLDIKFPKERIEYILDDANVELVLVKGEKDASIQYDGECIDISIDLGDNIEVDNLTITRDAHDLAYVLYTSGSTGKPKGVMVENQQVNNFIEAIVEATKINTYHSILCLTTISFDIFGLETLVPLTKGLNVVIANDDDTIDGGRLATLIQKYDVRVMQSTPSRIRVLLQNEQFANVLEQVEAILVGGEELPIDVFQVLSAYKQLEIYNVYGPTETTIWSTCKHMHEGEKITIGKPIGNTQIYILDQYQKLVPRGGIGELYIGGDGVTRGYINRPDLTEERFLANPFIAGQRIYRTGDLARWNASGEIEFFGRVDHQVKIRGYRIELGEIENVLLQYEAVKEAAVVAREDNNSEKFLCAYIVSNQKMDMTEVKKYMQTVLPKYMVPSVFTQIEMMPLTPNGKINRKALPEVKLENEISEEISSPRNEVEEKLVEIWKEVLDVKQIGIDEDFFDRGGNSLKATMLLARINKTFNKVISLKQIFMTPTIREIASYIEQCQLEEQVAITKCDKNIYYETSSQQHNMFTLQQLNQASTAYNLSSIYELSGIVDKEKLEHTFNELVKRHEALRTYFEMIDDRLVQKVLEECEIELIEEYDERSVEDIFKSFIMPFDMGKAPLFRVKLVKGKEKQYLLMDMHHSISDGMSVRIMMKDFIQLYHNKSLTPIQIQYKDFAHWYNQYLKSEQVTKQMQYWLEQFENHIPVLNLPYDFERPNVQSFNGGIVDFVIEEALSNEIRKMASNQQVTISMIMLAALNILLFKYSGQEEIVIGMPISGRNRAEIKDTVGMFVNTLALKNKVQAHQTVKMFLESVKENSITAYEHQNYPFETLIEKLGVNRQQGRNPLFDVMLDMNDLEDDITDQIDMGDLTIKECVMDKNVSKFDLTLKVVTKGQHFEMAFEYATDLFKRETIDRAVVDIQKIIEVIVKHQDIIIDEINILDEQEENMIMQIEDDLNCLRQGMFDF